MIINDIEYPFSTHISGLFMKGAFEIKLKEIETITDMSELYV